VRVLVACEFSGVVREAFRKRGHDAWSCDFKPPEDGSLFHFQCDVVEALTARHWDMLIAFPPCTHLCSSGAQYWKAKQANGLQQMAIHFVSRTLGTWVGPYAIENPVGILSSKWRKPDQIIHPFQFGDPYMKKTCLWLKGLPAYRPLARWSSARRKESGRYANAE
jgi:hypothetical protein